MNGEAKNHPPQLDFASPQPSILGQFSSETGESVAYLLIRELIDYVDRPSASSSARIQFGNDNQLEWIMQVVNHAFFLPMQNTREHDTVRAAVRIYLAWISGISVEPHSACPKPLASNPIKYFSQILDALRALFLPRTLNINDPASQILINRQSNEMRIILLALRNLYSRKTQLKEECKPVMWHQVLRFLMAVNHNLLGKPSWPDELSSVMASDLSEIMFDAWTQASLLGRITPSVYWKHLGELAQDWITYVPFVECWARKLLALTVVFSQKIYGHPNSTIVIHDEKLLSAIRYAVNHDQSGHRSLNDTHHHLFTLLGNPAQFFKRTENLCDKYEVDSSLQSYVMDQTSLAFYLAVSAYAKMVDIFFGDSSVSIDFHETEDLYAQWSDVNKTIQDDLSKPFQQQSHRTSNMSTTSSNHSNSYGNEQNMGTLTHNSLAQATSSISQHKRSIYVNPKSSSRLSSRSIHHAVSLQTDQVFNDASNVHQNVSSPIRPGQYVWYIMKSNRLRSLKMQSENRPPTDALLDMFLPWLYQAALMPLSLENRKYSEDVISQKSLSSADLDIQQQVQMSLIDNNGVNRRSFATSTASSSDISSPIVSNQAPYSTTLTASQLAEPSSIPSVDGIAAGRAAALAALCRIVCSKPSTERLNDEQLAQFLNLMHEAFIDRDRLILCSLIFHTTELFKLGLRGVEVLFPNYAMAIDLILTESFKLRLNPSIHEIDMRHACLRAMASILSWPTTFGMEPIITSTVSARLHHGAQNMLESGACYLEIRARFIKNIIHTLRNETDTMNLQLALALSCQLCVECTLYDLQPNATTPQIDQNSTKQERKNSTLSATDDSSLFVVSALKRIVSAICDNLCKPQWASELATTLAAFDCLNAIASQPKQVLFNKSELSIGSLIISSLCRFVNCQLQKPPPLHSKDLHSSVVAALQCLEVWLCAAPMLCEMESCIATVAQTIEFGMSGGNGLPAEEFKPASQRVYDAAEALQHSLFSSSALDSIVDEQSVVKKLGDDNLSMDQFQHFLIDKSTLLSLHDITGVDFVSKGLPTLVMISRTPHRAAHASLIQLRPFSHENKENFGKDSSPRTPLPVSSNPPQNLQSTTEVKSSTPRLKKAFEFTREMLSPKCQLDAALQRRREDSPEVLKVEKQLHSIRGRLASGAGCAVGDRDASNVWIQSALGALLCQPPVPEECVRKCNSIRVFLYDMGLINRSTYGNDLIALDTSSNISDFYTSLHQMIDKQPAKRCETVSLFYVRSGQHNASNILQNGDHIETLSSEFCTLISKLGRVRDIKHSNCRFWTGHWATAFDVNNQSEWNRASGPRDMYRLDGMENCIWFGDSHLEIAYILPTERSAAFNVNFMNETDGLSNGALKTREQISQSILFSLKNTSMERSDSEESMSEFIQPFASDSQKIMTREIDHTKLPERAPLEISIDDNDVGTESGRKSTVADIAFSKMLTSRPATNTSNSWKFFAKKVSMSPNVQEETNQEITSTELTDINLPSPQSAQNIQASLGSISYIKSFFRRRANLQSQVSTESNSTTVSSSSTPSSQQTKKLSDVTEQDLEEMFPRISKRPSSIKGYTPSSTSSSLAPASRTGSSLTNETGSAPKTDITHPPTSPAIRTRSTSTINSESSGSQQRPTQQAVNAERQSSSGQTTASTNLRRSTDQRILVVWLERIEDMGQFPYEQLLPATDDGSRRFAIKMERSDLHIIFVHNFEPGLVRIHVESVWTKSGQTGPLVDGVVVSTTALPILLRQTVANIARRKGIEVEQPSNSYRRRQSIVELAKKYASQVGYTEFLDRFITV